MKSRDLVCGMLFGLPIGGLLVATIMGAVKSRDEYPRRLLFGDITVWGGMRTDDARDEVAEELFLTRNDMPFLYVGEDAEGKATIMCLMNAHKGIVFTSKPSGQSSGWTDACYGRKEDGIWIGEHYRDIDLDGNFDVRSAYDRDGLVRSCDIYLQGKWQQVDRVEGTNAFSGPEVLSFDPERGWVPEKTSTE